MSAPALAKLTLYACPVGPLADQINAYFAAAQTAVGPNPAHNAMPHCALTGFFYDAPPTVAHYIDVLDGIVEAGWADRPSPVVTVKQLQLDERVHGFEVESLWLRDVAEAFGEMAHSPTRDRRIGIKDPLVLGLAYDFPPDQHEPLMELAKRHIDPDAPAHWELRFYEQEANGEWTCHYARALDLPHDQHPAG